MARLHILVYLAIFLSSIQSGVIACDEHNNGTLSDGSGVRVGSPNNATLPAPPKSHKAHPPQKNNLPKESPKNPPFVSDEDPDCGEAGPPTPSPSPPAGNSSTPSLPESPPAEGPAPSPSPPTGKSPTSNPPENPPCERPPAKGRARPSPLPPADKPAPPVANNEPVPTPTLVKKPAPSPIPEEINTAPSPIPVQLISSSTSEEATSQSDVDAYLESHNAFRAKHGAAPLVWNEELASKAKQWSANCKMEHSGGTLGPYGENLAASTGDPSIASLVKMWTDEASQYDPNNPVYSHFTQVVWKATTDLGCHVEICNNSGIFDFNKFGPTHFLVCEYFPAGNVIGKFGENVQP